MLRGKRYNLGYFPPPGCQIRGQTPWASTSKTQVKQHKLELEMTGLLGETFFEGFGLRVVTPLVFFPLWEVPDLNILLLFQLV